MKVDKMSVEHVSWTQKCKGGWGMIICLLYIWKQRPFLYIQFVMQKNISSKQWPPQ